MTFVIRRETVARTPLTSRGVAHGAADRCSGGEALCCLALWRYAHHVPYKPNALHGPYHQCRDIELAPAEAMEGGGGESVVVVVPRLAQGEGREPGEVARMVARVVAAPPEEVAQRIDRVGDVVQHEHPHGTAPQQSCQPGCPGSANRVAEPEGRDEPTDRPYEEGLVDEGHDRVGDQIGRVSFAVTAGGVDEQPADVCVGQTAQGTAQTCAVIHVRAVGVTVTVGEGVVLAVVGDPGDDWSLDRGRTEHREDEAQSRACLKRSVGKQAVKADRDAERREEIHDREHDEVRAVKQAVPQLPADEAEREDRADRAQPREEAVQVLVGGGLYVLGRWAVKPGTFNMGVLRGGRRRWRTLDRMGAHRCARRWKVARRADATRHHTMRNYPLVYLRNTGQIAKGLPDAARQH